MSFAMARTSGPGRHTCGHVQTVYLASFSPSAVRPYRSPLERFEEREVVELDEEKKAAKVSNWLVVLSSEYATQ